MKKGLILIISSLAFFACNPENLFDGPNFLIEDFESVDSLFELTDEGGNWVFLQTTNSQNTAAIDTINPHTGSQSIKFEAVSSERNTSKSDLANNDLAFHQGKVVEASAWYFICLLYTSDAADE